MTSQLEDDLRSLGTAIDESISQQSGVSVDRLHEAPAAAGFGSTVEGSTVSALESSEAKRSAKGPWLAAAALVVLGSGAAIFYGPASTVLEAGEGTGVEDDIGEATEDEVETP